mgnify:FL=1|tara:strand:+ start:20619 stop:21230 length:612 start_codon:yes stop_codon:yes gene_type:complete
MKFTKTATFLFPLLNVPKSLFDCHITDSWGRLKYKSRFLNAYLKNDTISKYKEENYIYVLARGYRDTDFDKFYTTVQAFPNFVDDYDIKECTVFIFSIPTDYINDFNLIINGKYSEVTANGKKLILANHYFSGKSYTLPLILNKAIVLKESWEERLSNPGSIAHLYDQEVWPIINNKTEILTNEVISNYTTNSKLTPTRDFFG